MNNVLNTERLILRPFLKEDSSFVLDALNQPSFIQYIGDRGVRTKEDAVNYIRKRFNEHWNEHGYAMMLVELKVANIAIGMCGLVKRIGLTIPDLGFAFLESEQGKGYAFEACNAVIEHAKNELLIKHLAAITRPDNKPSVKLLKKLEFEFIKSIELFDKNEKLMLFEKSLNM